RTLLLVLLGASTIANDLVEDVLDGVHGHHVHGRQVGLVTRRITVHARGPEHCQVVPHDLGGGLAVAVLESGGLLVCLSEQEPGVGLGVVRVERSSHLLGPLAVGKVEQGDLGDVLLVVVGVEGGGRVDAIGVEQALAEFVAPHQRGARVVHGTLLHLQFDTVEGEFLGLPEDGFVRHGFGLGGAFVDDTERVLVVGLTQVQLRGEGAVSLGRGDNAVLSAQGGSTGVGGKLVGQHPQKGDERQTEGGQQNGEYCGATLAFALLGECVDDLVGPLTQDRDPLDRGSGKGRDLAHSTPVLLAWASPSVSTSPAAPPPALSKVGAVTVIGRTCVTVFLGEVFLRVVVEVLVGPEVCGVFRARACAEAGSTVSASTAVPGLSSAHGLSQSSTRALLRRDGHTARHWPKEGIGNAGYTRSTNRAWRRSQFPRSWRRFRPSPRY